jgi:membrane protease YdiL (CAAX protease family)
VEREAGVPDDYQAEVASPPDRDPNGSPPAEPAAPAPPPVRPTRSHRWGIGAYVTAEAVFLGTSFLIGLMIAGTSPSAGTLAFGVAVPTVLAAGVALLITRIRGNGPATDLGLRWSWRDLGMGLAFGIGGLVITIPASLLYIAIAGNETTTAVGKVFGDVRAGPAAAIAVFAIVVLLAPLCEEILYRGLLWGAVERLGAGRWVTLGVTTLLFALAHLEFARTPLLLIVAIPIGLARLYTGRLLASIVAHQVNNLLPGIVLMLSLLGVVPMS